MSRNVKVANRRCDSKGPLGEMRDGQDVVEVALLERRAVLGRGRESGAFLQPGAQSRRGHRRVGAQPLPQRVLRLRGPRVVPAVVLIDDAQVHAVVVAARAAAEDTAGEQRAVVRAASAAVGLDDLGGDVPAPGLAVHVRPLRGAERSDEQASQVLRVGGGHARPVAAAAVRGSRPGVSLVDHHGPPVEVTDAAGGVGLRAEVRAAVGVHHERAVPGGGDGHRVGGAVAVPAGVTGRLSHEVGRAVDSDGRCGDGAGRRREGERPGDRTGDQGGRGRAARPARPGPAGEAYGRAGPVHGAAPCPRRRVVAPSGVMLGSPPGEIHGRDRCVHSVRPERAAGHLPPDGSGRCGGADHPTPEGLARSLDPVTKPLDRHANEL